MSSPERQHINPIELVTYDWVHSMLQHGVFNLEVEGFLQVGSPFGVSRKQIQEFLQDPAWRYQHFESSKQRQLHRIFDARRVGSDDKGHVKCTCAELVGVYGMLRLFAHDVPTTPLSANMLSL